MKDITEKFKKEKLNFEQVNPFFVVYRSIYIKGKKAKYQHEIIELVELYLKRKKLKADAFSRGEPSYKDVCYHENGGSSKTEMVPIQLYKKIN